MLKDTLTLHLERIFALHPAFKGLYTYKQIMNSNKEGKEYALAIFNEELNLPFWGIYSILEGKIAEQFSP